MNAWREAIRREYREGLYRWHRGLLGLLNWVQCMQGLGMMRKRLDGD